ncbi:MAG: hypothetical protein LBJ95_01990 [Oscillospiraceae bacterium]|nr:hypothetical protein [Oscillospiraceae bacterium]
MYIVKISWLKKATPNCCKIKKKTLSKANIARSSAESNLFLLPLNG